MNNLAEETVERTGPLRGPLRKRESNLWQREKNDHYVEPEWCSLRLFEKIQFTGTIVDPSCGFGHIVKSARASGLTAFGYDIVRRAGTDICSAECDFSAPDWQMFIEDHAIDNIVSNPPFGICDSKGGKPGYVERALARATNRVAMLLPANWIQGDKRSRWIAQTPLHWVLFITPRPSMPPGYVITEGQKPGNGTTDYAWFVWTQGYQGSPNVGWVRRDGDAQ